MVRAGHKPLEVVENAKRLGIEELAVAVSCGKDSTAVLELCRPHFRRLAGFFMYFVRGISFQEQYLDYLSRRYDMEIIRVPHWSLSRIYRQSVFRHATEQATRLRKLKNRHVEAYVRRKLGMGWIATGEKYCDSLERNAQLVRCGGIDPSRRRVWPIAWWTHSDVDSYLAGKRVMLPPDYRLDLSGRDMSAGSLISMTEAVAIKEHFPADYERIRRVFPLIEGQVVRYELLKSSEQPGEADGKASGKENTTSQ